MSTPTVGYAATSPESKLTTFHFERRALRDDDVALDIMYCGICHSDLHTAENDWGRTQYPIVPGHEIVGRVTDIGDKVTTHKVGDIVAVGCMVDSCLECDQCDEGEEQFCRKGMTGTYAGRDRITGEPTHGGYSKHIVVKDHFVLTMPKSLDVSKAAPILCAGITTYSPLRYHEVEEGTRVGVIGLGGLGHMAIKLAAAMGAEVTAVSRSDDKFDEAKSYGATHTLLSKDKDAMKKARGSMDVIINTVPVKHDLNPYVALLDIDGSMVMVGQIGPVDEVNTGALVMGRRSIEGSLIGGIAETQEVLDFCAEHDILPEVEMIAMEDINDAYDRLKKGDLSHRLIIDMTKFEPEAA